MEKKKQHESILHDVGYLLLSLCGLIGFVWLGYHVVIRPISALFEMNDRIGELERTVSMQDWKVDSLEARLPQENTQKVDFGTTTCKSVNGWIYCLQK